MIKKVLITGITGKFGNIFLDYFIKNNYHVIGTSRSQKSLDQLKNKFGLDKKQFTSMVVDFSSDHGVQDICKNLALLNIEPDILINNARNLDNLKVEDSGISSRSNFLNEFLLNVIVPYELTMFLSKNSKKLSKVINIGSQYGLSAANPNLYDNYIKDSAIQYGVSKAAVCHLTKELAVRLASKKIQINCIAYGGLEGRVNKDFKLRFSKLSPIGRMLKKDEICSPIEMLLNSKSFPMTGQTLVFDGGWSIW